RRDRRVALVPRRRIFQDIRQGRRHRHGRSCLQIAARPAGGAPVSEPQRQPVLAPITSVGEAEQVITHLQAIMDALVKTVEDETALVRKGRLRDATQLEAAKAELSRQYTQDTERLVQSKK